MRKTMTKEEAFRLFKVKLEVGKYEYKNTYIMGLVNYTRVPITTYETPMSYFYVVENNYTEHGNGD